MSITWFAGLFDTDRWMPRWSCGKWEPWEGWLYIISDLLIALAYFAIPAIIAAYIWKRKSELPFVWVFLLFFLFIFFCGATHLVDAIIFWEPVYQFSAFLRMLTAIVSLATVFALMYVMPQALKLKTAVQFERELQQRLKIELELAEKYKELELAQHIARIASWSYTYDNPEIKASNKFYEIFGVPKGGQYTSLELRNNIHPDDLPIVQETLERARKTGESYEIQYRYIKPDTGDVAYIYSKGEASINSKGEIIGAHGFSQDVTQLKTTESNLQKRAMELESINKELELFAYAASHDLQEPLRKLRAFGDRLSQKYADKLDDQGKDYIRRMDAASNRMQSLIEDLLTYSRLSRNKDQEELIDLNVLLPEVISDLEETIAQKNIEVHIDNLPTVQAVPNQMRQLFQNLLSNAFKFTRSDVQPRVEITCQITKGRTLPWKNELNDVAKYYVITIKDNGIGFEQQFSEKIFAMFQRLHGRNEFKGTGIGLALCKKIVENHQGIIKAEGAENQGAVFTVVLPVKKNS